MEICLRAKKPFFGAKKQLLGSTEQFLSNSKCVLVSRGFQGCQGVFHAVGVNKKVICTYI